jgi:hypothetical protein
MPTELCSLANLLNLFGRDVRVHMHSSNGGVMQEGTNSKILFSATAMFRKT